MYCTEINHKSIINEKKHLYGVCVLFIYTNILEILVTYAWTPYDLDTYFDGVCSVFSGCRL